VLLLLVLFPRLSLDDDSNGRGRFARAEEFNSDSELDE